MTVFYQFDWDKAAELLVKHRVFNASAGLSGDWSMTAGVILENGKIPNIEDWRGHISSYWAIPTIRLFYEGDILADFECYYETTNGKTDFWPESARRILDPFFLTQLYAQ